MLYHGLSAWGSSVTVPEEHTVHQCEQCQAGSLPQSGFSYEEDEYRQRVESSAAIEDFYRLHDREQAEKLGILGTETLRGQMVADIGCGGGSFLDFLYGVAQRPLPSNWPAPTRMRLPKNTDISNMVPSRLARYAARWTWRSVCGDQHVADPGSLQEIRRLLKPGGSLLLSTPNYDDWLISFLPGGL